MSHLLKALRSLESRGALTPVGSAIAPQPPAPTVPEEGAGISLLVTGDSDLVKVTETPDAAAARLKPRLAQRMKPRPAQYVKPRPAKRIKPRPASAPEAAKLPIAKPLMTTLSQLPAPPAENQENSPTPSAAAVAQAMQYTLAPAIVVNQAALDAGTALARELFLETAVPRPCEDLEVSDNSRTKTPAPIVAPPRSPTPFEHRIRETLSHSARCRPFADLVQRLRQDLRSGRERALLFTGIGDASRGDEMLAHVAALLAQQGERVLLVDADFERAGLTENFGAGKQAGLADALTVTRNWQDHLVATSFDNLTLLPVGDSKSLAAINAKSLAAFVSKLEAEYPLILIDGGPSSSSLILPLAQAATATYFVIRLGATDAREAQGALKTFRSAGARVMGCVAVMANSE